MTLLKICKEVVSSPRTSFEIHIGERLICARAKHIPFEVWRAYARSVHPLEFKQEAVRFVESDQTVCGGSAE
jgi:hypothetical protein